MSNSTPDDGPNQGENAPASTDTGVSDGARQFGALVAETPDTDDADTILRRAATLDHDHVLAAVSGGHDSLTALHVAHSHDALSVDGIVHIDTGIRLPMVEEFVRERAAVYNLPVYIADERRQEDEYATRIQKYGFPGSTKENHKWEYINNKDKPLDNLLQEFDGDVLIISGASRFESDARWDNVPADGIGVMNGRTWVSPIAGWTGSEVRAYRRKHDLPMSPVKLLFEASGDCFCGCFSDRATLATMHRNTPWLWAYIQSLEVKVIDAARTGQLKKPEYEQYVLWAHGGMPDREFDQRLADSDQMLLCQSCERAASGECAGSQQVPFHTLTEAALQLPEEDLPDSPTAFRDQWDLTQHIPDDADQDPVSVLKRAYQALDDVAERLGYEDHKEMVESKVEERIDEHSDSNN